MRRIQLGFERVARRALCAAGLALVACSEAPPPATPDGPDAAPATVSPNAARGVLVLTIDTLRADALGAYGNLDAQTPAIDRLAAQSLVFERAYSQATITHPALTSMLTGLLPVHHGIGNQAARMREGVTSVAALAQRSGVRTASFVANLCRLQEQSATVFHDGWDTRFCGMDDAREQYEWDADVVDAAIDWLQTTDEPFFAWVHLMDPHAEHRPPPDLWDYDAQPVRSKEEQYVHYGEFEESRQMLPPDEAAHLAALYAAEVTGADRQVGRLMDALDALPGGKETAVLFGSDHGEELFETWSRYDHGLSMTEGVLWVPLFLRAPNVAPARVARPVELLSVAPTIVDLLGLPNRIPMDGPGLLAEAGRDYALSFAGSVSVSVRTDERRYWLRRTAEPYTRGPDEFPWRADAPWFLEKECLARYGESAPTAVDWLDIEEPQHGEVAAELRSELERFAKRIEQTGPERAIEDPELDEQLRQLGYSEGD